MNRVELKTLKERIFTVILISLFLFLLAGNICAMDSREICESAGQKNKSLNQGLKEKSKKNKSKIDFQTQKQNVFKAEQATLRSKIESNPKALDKKEKTIQINQARQIGRYYYTGHALDRMAERGINADGVAYAIGHGNRYNITKTIQGDNGSYIEARQLIADLDNGIGVVLDPATNMVITAWGDFNQYKLDSKLAKRRSMTKKECIAAKKDRKAKQQRPPLVKKELIYADYCRDK